MDANYLVLCGMVWTRFGQETAGRELIRALASSDEIVRVLARTMLEQGRRLERVDRPGAGGGRNIRGYGEPLRLRSRPALQVQELGWRRFVPGGYGLTSTRTIPSPKIYRDLSPRGSGKHRTSRKCGNGFARPDCSPNFESTSEQLQTPYPGAPILRRVPARVQLRHPSAMPDALLAAHDPTPCTWCPKFRDQRRAAAVLVSRNHSVTRQNESGPANHVSQRT